MGRKCRSCKYDGQDVPCSVCIWRNDFFEAVEETPKPTSPPEMPEVEPELSNLFGSPKVLGRCIRYGQKVGKKEANSCVGCTVGCPGKGKQEPKGTLECKVIGCYDLNKTGTCMREEGPCNRQEIP